MKQFLTKTNLFIGLATALVVIFGAMMATSIVQRKYETKILQSPSVKIPEGESRNSIWGKAYPHQWNSYLEATKKGDMSRNIVDELEYNPSLVILWAGYGFSKDYNRPRGHTFAVTDTINSLRTGAPTDTKSGPMPATCMSCKSPDVPRLMEQSGIKEFYQGKWAKHVEQVINPIGCGDCHNNETMALQISRPALVEAFERQGTKLSEVSHQQMRSLVCAQCHVEYYFKKPDNYLTFPWDEGMKVEEIEAYYDDSSFKDWTHKLSKAPMLKAQHPGYELFSHGIHGKRDVACADCHMPYKTVGGVKFSDHHIQSPLQNVANACQQCHRVSESELLSNVSDLKAKILDLKLIAEKELVAAHFEAKEAWDLGASEAQMQTPLQQIRHSQWRWDFSTAAHGAYFHAPEEVLRILGTSIYKAGQARRSIQAVLSELGFKGEVKIPDISSKGKAQKIVGLEMDELIKGKKKFINTLVKQWWESSPVRDEEFMKYVEEELRR